MNSVGDVGSLSENKNRNVLVLCPKKLSENWNTYKGNYRNNPLVEDRLRYMEAYSDLLSMAVESIISATEDNKVTSFIKGKQMSFFSENISGLDDFELIGFIVVKE